MTPTEDYFYCNNIQIWSNREVSNLIWFNTDEGQFIQNGYGHLYKETENSCERVV